MKKNKIVTGICAALLVAVATVCNAQQQVETRFERSLSDVLADVSAHFGVQLSYDIDTVGKVVPYADYRIRPYSVEESLTNLLAPFDYTFTKQDERRYKLKRYEYPRRTPADGKKMLDYLTSLYPDKGAWEQRKECLYSEVRERLGIDSLLSKRVHTAPVLSEVRRYDGYTVQNFALETLPGLFVAGSIYTPLSEGKHALVVSPNGHFADGRYREEQQLRLGTLARMGAACVSYDLFGWGESALQVGSAAHRTSAAQVIQAMNGIAVLDYMLSRGDIDEKRIGVSGGSGGGSQTVLLSLLDDRYTAAAPVVMVTSHFDGGCPCESGLPTFLACGGTNNAELAALFAPRPLLLVSVGGDWTASTPTLEYPYVKGIYAFYNEENKVHNVHLPDEGHDFGVNKRNAVYHFFASQFSLDRTKIDEGRVTLESEEDLKVFGREGEGYPPHAIRSFAQLMDYFEKEAYTNILWNLSLEKKAAERVDFLNLENDEEAAFLKNVIYDHLKAVSDWHDAHPYTTVPEGINPLTGDRLSELDRQMIASSAIPTEVHEALMDGLRSVLNEEQVEAVLDKYTVGKVDFTLRGFKAIVPDLTKEEEETILAYLKEAREKAIDYKYMKQISAIFEIYKTKSEQYLIGNGRNWRQLYKDFVDKLNAEKEK